MYKYWSGGDGGGGGGGYLPKLYAGRLSLEIQPFTFLHTVEPPVTAKGDTSLHLILLAEEIFLSLLPIAVNDSKLTFTFSFGFSPAWPIVKRVGYQGNNSNNFSYC